MGCRFLVDPVPCEYVDESTRHRTRDFILSSQMPQTRKEPEHPEWLPHVSRSKGGGVWCAQVNARKDGTLFNNMFYLKEVVLDEKTYIVGLQSELPRPSLDVDAPEPTNYEMYRKACRQLDQNMVEVERILSKMFWFTAPMRRQEDVEHDGFISSDSDIE